MLFNLLHELFLFDANERQSSAFVVSSRCSANSMDVRLHVIRKVEVDHVGHELEVDSADHAGLFVFIALALKKQVLICICRGII